MKFLVKTLIKKDSKKRKIEEKKIEVKVSYQKFPSPFSLNIVAVGASDVVLMEDRKEMIREMHKEIMEMIECMK